MTGWLVDTNVLSEWRRPQRDARVVQFLVAQPIEILYVSVLTFAEIRFGIELLPDAARRTALTNWLDQKLRPMFEGRTLEITEDIMLQWRLLLEQGRKRGHTCSEPDLIIAATALHHRLTVVTRNASEYELAGVPVLNPWK